MKKLVGKIEVAQVGNKVELLVNDRVICEFTNEELDKAHDTADYLKTECILFENGDVMIEDNRFTCISGAVIGFFSESQRDMMNCVWNYLRILEQDNAPAGPTQEELNARQLKRIVDKIDELEVQKLQAGSDWKLYQKLSDEIYYMEVQKQKVLAVMKSEPCLVLMSADSEIIPVQKVAEDIYVDGTNVIFGDDIYEIEGSKGVKDTDNLVKVSVVFCSNFMDVSQYYNPTARFEFIMQVKQKYSAFLTRLGHALDKTGIHRMDGYEMKSLKIQNLIGHDNSFVLNGEEVYIKTVPAIAEYIKGMVK